MEIFDLGAPITVDADFHTGAGGPTNIGAGGGASWLHRLDVAVGDAARDLGQPAVECVTDSCACGANPALLDLALAAAVSGTDAPQAGSIALDAHPVGISFNTEHDGTGLPVVPELSADQSAGDIKISRIRTNRRIAPTRMAPGIAAINAGIETRPTERQLPWRFLEGRWVSPRWDVGGLHRHRAKDHTRDSNHKSE